MAATVSDGEGLPPASVGIAPTPPPVATTALVEAAVSVLDKAVLELRDADAVVDVIVDNVV